MYEKTKGMSLNIVQHCTDVQYNWLFRGQTAFEFGGWEVLLFWWVGMGMIGGVMIGNYDWEQ